MALVYLMVVENDVPKYDINFIGEKYLIEIISGVKVLKDSSYLSFKNLFDYQVSSMKISIERLKASSIVRFLLDMVFTFVFFNFHNYFNHYFGEEAWSDIKPVWLFCIVCFACFNHAIRQ